ncbi:Armadillo-type fold,Armadillo-like helical [Cinara cedri]|uniref:Armadillo-type fold,Armadillo-like helical n=1 Tax=Cinara cedri TaxID=506608 RepID=A0A5E4MDM0_9HEMI|nr:Armadillo-type fold,Armadillo-like helical [Cinara cedri]
MESTHKVGYSKISVTGPVDLQMLLNPSVNIKVKLQLLQKIYDVLGDCCKTQQYFDTMVFVFVKLLTIVDPSFTPEQDQFKMRLLIIEIIHKVCNDTHNKDKLKCHIQNLMRICLKIIESDNERSVVLCIFIYRDLLTVFQPKFDGFFKMEILNFFKLILDIYRNSSTPDKIFPKHKSNDLKVLIKTVRHNTVIRTNNADSFNLIPMGRISLKVIKEFSGILKLYYVLYHDVRAFIKDILDFVPVLMNFFNLDIPYKPDYRDLVLDLKHAQAKLLSFFSIILKDHKNTVYVHCSPLPGRLISLLSCNMSSDDSSLRLELLSGLEYVILSDYKCEFLPHMDKFIDETLITGKNWSLKQTLRPRAYIYIDHLTTNLRGRLSMNFLMRVIHLYFSNILDCTLQPE